MADTTGTSRYVPSYRSSVLLASLAVALFVISLAAVFYLQSLARDAERQLAQLAIVQAAVSALERHAERAGIGAVPAFEQIRQASRQGGEAMTRLEQGDDAGLRPLNAAVAEERALLGARWTQADAAASRLLAAQPAQSATSEAARAIVDGSAALTAGYETLVQRLASRGVSEPLALASRQLVGLERLTHAARLATLPRASEQRVVEILESESTGFAADHADLLQTLGADPQLAPLLREAGAAFGSLQAAVRTIASQTAGMQAMHAAAAELGASAAAAAAAADALASSMARHAEPRWGDPVVFGLGSLGVLLLGASLYSSVRNARRAQAYAEERDSRQQAAILSLLDEITNLADGDLTVDVTVTEDFTGAIADSINYTVDTLRRLVGTINDTSVEIAAAATSTQETAQRMSQASERQAREINSVANIVTQTSQSLNQVAARAEELAQQATSSVQIAHNGAATVGRTIQGMATLREQIQETAKRIKRLGESSQEIGNIIEFINDISEQTNTLALNASIQAAMAGDAGRGFAVVADEVQRLAERTANATRQVETLVKTIQADTHEAIISMERSTSTVVSGAKSAEEAGQALTRIESSSTELARMIQEISLDARSQSAQAAKIAGQMQIIREIAVQTSSAAGQTAQAVGELTNLSEKLRESVAGFKLPSEPPPPGRVALQSAA